MRQLTISQTRSGVDRSEFLVTEQFQPAFRATGGLLSREHGLELAPVGRDGPAFRLRYDPGANLRRALAPRCKTWSIRRGGETLGTLYQSFRLLRPNAVHLDWQGRHLIAEHVSLGEQGTKLVIFEDGRQLGLAERDPVTENLLDQYRLFCLEDSLAEAMVLLVLYYDWYWFGNRGRKAAGTSAAFYWELFPGRKALYDPAWTEQFFQDDPVGLQAYQAAVRTQGRRSRKWLKYTKRILLAFVLFWAVVLGIMFFITHRTVTRPVYTIGDDAVPSLYAAVGSRHLEKSSIGGGRRFLVFVSDTPEADVRAYQAILPEEWTVDAFDTGFSAWQTSADKPDTCLTLYVTWTDDTVTVYLERIPAESVCME